MLVMTNAHLSSKLTAVRWFVEPHIAMFQYFAIATAILAVCNAADNNLIGRAYEDLVQVDIYYTSLCTNAVSQFVTTQFFPTYELLGNFTHVTYIPYGQTQHELVTDATGNPQWNFTCQFGEMDCYGNKAHACAINEILTNPAISDEQQRLATFIACTFASRNSALFVNQCLLSSGVPPTSILSVNNCAISTKGDELLVAHGQTTQALQPPLKFVPTIIINKTDQDLSFFDFQSIICQNIPAETRPTICSGSTSLHTTKNIFAIFIFSLIFYVGKGTNHLF